VRKKRQLSQTEKFQIICVIPSWVGWLTPIILAKLPRRQRLGGSSFKDPHLNQWLGIMGSSGEAQTGESQSIK
jgi:hypothetical protein